MSSFCSWYCHHFTNEKLEAPGGGDRACVCQMSILEIEGRWAEQGGCGTGHQKVSEVPQGGGPLLRPQWKGVGRLRRVTLLSLTLHPWPPSWQAGSDASRSRCLIIYTHTHSLCTHTHTHIHKPYTGSHRNTFTHSHTRTTHTCTRSHKCTPT